MQLGIAIVANSCISLAGMTWQSTLSCATIQGIQIVMVIEGLACAD